MSTTWPVWPDSIRLAEELASKESLAVSSFVLSSIPARPPQLAAATVVGRAGFLSLGAVMGNPARFKRSA